jgi:hypothetical protein
MDTVYSLLKFATAVQMAVTEGDPSGEPFQDLAPVDIRMLLEAGVPPECINGRKLDVLALGRLGWRVTRGSVSPPIEADDGDEETGG